MRWTIDQLNAYEARRLGNDGPSKFSTVERENTLHQEVLDECKRRGWLAIHGRMDCPSSVTVGAPDFIILTEAKVLFIECKTKTGKCSDEQLSFNAWANRLGHNVHVCRSFQEFMEIIKL